jgi:sec-independent protein translocase protein TatA
MFGDLGAPELIIILIIILLLFGPGRIGQVAGELGKGIHNFREGLSGKEETPDKQEPPPPDQPPTDQPQTK